MVGVRKSPLSSDQLGRIIASCESEFERRTILIYATTGMHVSVLPKLTLENLLERGGRVKLEWPRPKTGRLVSVPVAEEVRPWIKEYLSLPFPPRYKSDDYYYGLVKRVASRAGLPSVSPMSFRHTVGFRLHQEGGPSAPVKLLGVSPRVVATYASLEDEAIDSHAERILSSIVPKRVGTNQIVRL